MKDQTRGSDPVNHPQHYKGMGGIEAIDVIEGFELGYSLGNAVKYILRADRKGFALTDLRKARWYIDREIETRTRAEGKTVSEAMASSGEIKGR